MIKKEIEEWIKANNPYKHPTADWVDDYKVWAKGARAMAEHLCEQGRIENDAAFLLGMEAANKIAPTCEHIAKVWRLCNLSFRSKAEDIFDYVRKNWYDEV